MPKNHEVKIPKPRWLAYAGAGAATALTGTSAADAEIHYSGRVDTTFLGMENKEVAFPLDQPGNSIVFFHSYIDNIVAGQAFFEVQGLQSAAFIGYLSSFLESPNVSKLTGQGRYISQGHFLANYNFGTMAGVINHIVRGDWADGGLGFVGFRFNRGSGIQYGWARVRMRDVSNNFAFKVLDHAYADPGEPIKAGQKSSAAKDAPDEGSLGFLALGAAGVALWRQRRKDRSTQASSRPAGSDNKQSCTLPRGSS